MATIASQESRERVAALVRQGNSGKLELGGEILIWDAAGVDRASTRDIMLKEHGVQLPGDSRLSVYAGAYREWVVEQGLNPDDPIQLTLDDGQEITTTLSSIPVDKLYHARGLLNPGEVTMEEVLQKALSLPEKAIRRLAKGEPPEEAKEPLYGSLRLPIEIYGRFLAFQERMREISGVPTLTPTSVMEFVLGRMDGLADDALDFLWREDHGELTDDEADEVTEFALAEEEETDGVKN